MRILYVINSLEGGGASAPIPAIAGFLRSQGCEVRIAALTPRDRRGLPAIARAGLPVTIRDGGERDHLRALRWLDAEAMRWQPDLIWTSLTRATLLGQIVGQTNAIPVVSWQHAAYLKPINALLLRWRRRRSIFWVADSDNVAAWARKTLRLDPARIGVWPLFAADQDAPQARPWQPGTPIRIGSLGRLHRVKGYDVLIAALAELRTRGACGAHPIEIEIAGDGDLRCELVTQASCAGLHRLRFVGFTEPRSFLAGLHLYLQPSRSEGLCIAAHEAMAAGLPVLASAVGELRHSILDGESGGLVPPGDARALAARLAEMLRDPARLATMGAVARRRVLDRFGKAAFTRAGTSVLERIKSAHAAAQASCADRSASRARSGRPSSHRSA
jgi:glycosyltransferase involved in cell wall biosynthesis